MSGRSCDFICNYCGKTFASNQSLLRHIEKCKIEWCLVAKDNFKGWVDKKHIWGLKEKEIILDNPTKITYNINITNNGEASERA